MLNYPSNSWRILASLLQAHFRATKFLRTKKMLLYSCLIIKSSLPMEISQYDLMTFFDYNLHLLIA